MPAWTKWLLGILSTLLTAGVIGSGAKLAEHGEEIAIHSARYEGLVKGQDRIERKQDRLEEKIDRLIERTK